MRQDVQDIILKYGSHIINSDEFKKTFEQTHHYSTTVGDHTLGVTVEAVKFCLYYGLTDDRTLSNVVTACLCHDLGIIGRHDKYKNRVQTLIWHPRHSAQAYMNMTGEEDKRVLNSILCHMFPLKMCIPRYKESWILVLADKVGASRETLKIPSVTVEEREELLKLARERTEEINRVE